MACEEEKPNFLLLDATNTIVKPLNDQQQVSITAPAVSVKDK